MLGSGAEDDGCGTMANFSGALSLGGVVGRSLSETSVDAEEKPGDGMGSLRLRECDECAGGE
jgi:hypothetical protein